MVVTLLILLTSLICILVYAVYAFGFVTYEVGDSRVAYFNDIALHGDKPWHKISRCKNCNLIYSDYVCHNSYPCPRCGEEESRDRVFAKLKIKRPSFFERKQIFWEIKQENK